MPILLVLLVIPLIEIALFIEIGGLLTLWPTLALVVAGPVLGVWVIRRQGLRTMDKLRATLDAGRDPAGPMADGAVQLVAGLLLILPGFLTDSIGLLLLVPAVRRRLIRAIARRATIITPHRRPGPVVLEGEYTEVTDADPEAGETRPTPWSDRGR
jgi:UPF0716 protein FxsA